jgi:choline transport protein
MLSAGFIIPIPQMITALVLYLDPAYSSPRWHMFLMYQAVNLIFTAYNILLLKRTAWIYDIGCKSYLDP